MKVRWCLLIFTIAILAASIAAQRSSVIRNESAGFSFKVPPGFSAKTTPDGYSLSQRSDDLAVLVVMHEYNNAETFAEKVDLADYGLTIDGEPKQINATDYSFKATSQTAKGTMFVDAFLTFSPHGGGLVILSLASAAKSNISYQTGYEVYKSISYLEPKLSALGQKVVEFLKGKRLVKRRFKSGYTEERIIQLCSDGTFSRRSSGSAGAGATIRANSVGNWRISSAGGIFLVLQTSAGNNIVYELDEDTSSLKIKLNGVSFFVKDAGC